MKKQSENKNLPRELFIDDLGKVTGGCGRGATTLAFGEEDGGATTLALGEEDGGGITTMMLGEE